MSGGHNDGGHVPSKGDELGGSDFVEGSGSLRRLGDGDATYRKCGGDEGAGGGGGLSIGVVILIWIVIFDVVCRFGRDCHFALDCCCRGVDCCFLGPGYQT